MLQAPVRHARRAGAAGAGRSGSPSSARPGQLKLAAGPVGSDEQGNPRGLYREHCAHCHGITGDGAGPTAAFLNPYPRDYRKGKFKFKSTPIGQKPTHDDLKKIVLEGIPGTAMPSFKLLPDLEVEALVDYVKYLSIRGEVGAGACSWRAVETGTTTSGWLQRRCAEGATAEQKDGPAGPDCGRQEKIGQTSSATGAGGRAMAEPHAELPPRPEMTQDELAASSKRGRDLFYGTVANCIKCHGDSALGDGQTTDYDDWTKEFIDDGKEPES